MASHGSHAHPSPDVTIDYFAAGEGRPVVLVHGITESRRTWDPLIAPLIAADYRVVAVDLRGHGDSSKVAPYDLGTMAADLGAVLAEEQVDDALLVGHSLGGAVVSAFAAGGPCRIQGRRTHPADGRLFHYRAGGRGAGDTIPAPGPRLRAVPPGGGTQHGCQSG